MNEECFRMAFEIKLACDVLSRRLLRWHWEKTPRPNTLKELLRYVQKRSIEAPEYYTNLSLETEITSWQQLDTTFCMRVLLDNEEGAKTPKRLLQYALQDKNARRACNGLRLARNAAAHAADKTGVVKAISLFEETLEDLERAYGMLLFEVGELEQYDTLLKKAKAACGKKEATAKKKTTSSASSTRKTSSTKKTTQKKAATRTKKQELNQHSFTREKIFCVLAILVFLLALWVQRGR